MPDFATALRSGAVLLMDGAMGTELQHAGVATEQSYETWNLTHPEKVRAIHRSYVQAGAEVLLSNTFQANPPALARQGQADNLHTIIREGLALARAVLSCTGWVLADIGPFPLTGVEALRHMLAIGEQADGLLLETFSNPREAAALVAADRSLPGPARPILVSFTFDGKTLRTFQGATPEECARAAVDMNVAALGVNCGRDLNIAACAEILGRYRATTALPLFARPNAGTPTAAGHYPHSPEQMADELPDLLRAGAVMVGGCCGTTPRHIEAFRDVVNDWNASRSRLPGGT